MFVNSKGSDPISFTGTKDAIDPETGAYGTAGTPLTTGYGQSGSTIGTGSPEGERGNSYQQRCQSLHLSPSSMPRPDRRRRS